jgi:hypothetical protein
MKSSKVAKILPIALLLFLVWSCDTPDNVSPPDYFIKYFGEEGHQEGVDLLVNADGTILLFGNTSVTREETGQNFFLVKSDANGNVLWQKTFGGKNQENAKDIEVTSDGRVVLLGTTKNDSGDSDILLITTDATGVKIDSVVYGYPGTDEKPASVTQTTDGFIVTGSTTNVSQKKANPIPGTNDQQDAFNFRFYDDLSLYSNSWNETLGPGTIDAGVKVIQVGTGFYFFGYSNKATSEPSSQSGLNFWIFPLSNFGIGAFEVGEEIFVGGVADERLSSVTLSPPESGEGFLLTGIVTNALGTSSSIYITKLRKSLNFSAGASSQVFQVDGTSLGNELGTLTDFATHSSSSILSGFFILCNDHSSGNENFYLTKVTNLGKPAWSSPQGFVFGGLNEDSIGSVSELPNGSILMIGTFSVGDDRQHKMTLIKVNKDGKFQ